MWLFQQCDALCRNLNWPAKYKGANRIRGNDNRDERKEWVVNKRAALDGDFVEAKQESDGGRHQSVQPQKRREGDENTDRKCKRRPLWWIIQREQTAKGRAKHLKVGRVLDFRMLRNC